MNFLGKFYIYYSKINGDGSIGAWTTETDLLPEVDYYALGHLHIDFRYKNFIYPGPIFPNNFQELEDLKSGSFYIVDTSSNLEQSLKKIELKITNSDSGDVFENIPDNTASRKPMSEIFLHVYF